ncbi:hypothetical protein PFISCL1PPCAC_7436, partial [Pristionchus fissidentatus]
MTSSITSTPFYNSGDLVSKKNRVLKERERRARETVAFKNLRHALDVADPHTFWRMERVDIVEGAVFLIKQ